MTDPQLFVHIGAGKTGTSSIQRSLEHCQPSLIDQRAKYLGIMLEHASTRSGCEWQQRGGSDRFFQSDEKNRSEKIHEILLKEMYFLKRHNLQCAIWSNEWMFGRHDRIIPALKKLNSDGFDVRIVCYIRRHDKWALSAYQQWGIKHKTYRGRIKSFSEWIENQNLDFHSFIRPWIEAFPTSFILRNYDAVGDVVSDFSRVIDISLPERIDDNRSPCPELLAAWAVYNAKSESQVRPEKFMHLSRRLGIDGANTLNTDRIDNLVPTPEQLQSLLLERSADVEALNEILAAQGQPPLRAGDPMKSTHFDDWKMSQILIRSVCSLQEQILKLEDKIKTLDDQTDEA